MEFLWNGNIGVDEFDHLWVEIQRNQDGKYCAFVCNTIEDDASYMFPGCTTLDEVRAKVESHFG